MTDEDGFERNVWSNRHSKQQRDTRLLSRGGRGLASSLEAPSLSFQTNRGGGLSTGTQMPILIDEIS